MIAYGRLIDTRVEISTVGEANAQLFSEPESFALYRESHSGICGPLRCCSYPYGSPSISAVTLEEPKALLKNSGIEEPKFWILDFSTCNNGSRLPAHGARSLYV